MTLRVAVQMDPLHSINIAGDSSFALMLSAQERGHELYYYDVKSLAWKAGRVTAEGAPVTVHYDPANPAKAVLETKSVGGGNFIALGIILITTGFMYLYVVS